MRKPKFHLGIFVIGRNPQATIYTSTTITDSNTFQMPEPNRKHLRKSSIDDTPIRNEMSEHPLTIISASTTESVDFIKMRTYIILTEKCIIKDYIII